MKKVIAILLVLLVTGVVFGADATTSLDLGASVGGRYGLIITGSGVTDPETRLAFGLLEPVGTSESPIVFSEGDLSESLKVHLMTNKNSAYDVIVTAAPLTAGGDTDIIYDVNNTTVSGANTEITLHSITAAPGLTISSQAFEIVIDSDSWENAAEGEYSTTWTVELKVQS